MASRPHIFFIQLLPAEHHVRVKHQELEQLIAERTGAYILEEAARLGMQIQARVETAPGDDGMPVPVRVEITGAYSAQLSEWIARELVIPGEEQIWHEENLEE